MLTFDDGPDPVHTPAVLDILQREHVPATFFVIGRSVADHPEIVQRIWAEGHEIANHTFTHPQMGSEASWRQRLELALTDRVIAGAIGRCSIAYRLPFSGAASAASRADLELIRDAGEGWRAAVFADYFARDYNAASADDILANVDRLDPSEGLVLLLHDGGGDRSATVGALEQLVPLLRKRGFTFVSLSEAIRANDQAINPPAPAIERWSGLMLITVLRVVGVLRGGVLLPLYALLGWGFVRVALDVRSSSSTMDRRITPRRSPRDWGSPT